MEHFLHVPSRLCREQFFKVRSEPCSILQLACLFSLRQLIRPGHILIGTVLTASARDLLVRLLCFDDGRRRVLHDLKLTVSEILNDGLTDTSSPL